MCPVTLGSAFYAALPSPILVLNHGLTDFHRFSLKRYTRLARSRPGRKFCFGPYKSLCYSRIWTQFWSSIMMTTIMYPLITHDESPVTRTQCPIVENKVLIPMKLLQNLTMTAVLRKHLTGSLILPIHLNKRQRKNPRCCTPIQSQAANKLSAHQIQKPNFRIGTRSLKLSASASTDPGVCALGGIWFCQ